MYVAHGITSLGDVDRCLNEKVSQTGNKFAAKLTHINCKHEDEEDCITKHGVGILSDNHESCSKFPVILM